MRDYSLTHLTDTVLLRDLADLIVKERGTVATILAHIGEVDARRLFEPLGYSSMHGYCMKELHLSEDAAYKRIQAARAARRFPVLFEELAEGRLHLTAVCMLAPHLTRGNVDELVRAATYRRQAEIQDLLAVCSARGIAGVQGVLGPEQVEGSLAAQQVGQGLLVAPQVGGTAEGSLAVQQVGGAAQGSLAVQQVGGSLAAQQVEGTAEGLLAAQQVGTGSILSQVETLVPLMVKPGTRDRVRYLQALLSHAIPSGDISEVLDRALDLLTEQVEKRRFGTGAGPIRRRRSGERNRYIPAPVRHAVWNRDEGRCTFVGTKGHRCESMHFLEFDHVDPRNREDTVEGLRLRCRAHNQYEAERIFGTEFMRRKREEARLAAQRRREEVAATAGSSTEASNSADAGRSASGSSAETGRSAEYAELEEQIRDVLSALRRLGIRGEQARRAAAHARTLPSATLTDRIRAALQFHGECIMRCPKSVRALHASG